MIRIGKSYLVQLDGMSRLCADIEIDGAHTLLWFETECVWKECLCVGRADAFVMALLPVAVRGRHKIICEDAMSERLHYQLNDYLMPALNFGEKGVHFTWIHAPLTTEGYQNFGAVGAAFPGDTELYSFVKDSEKYGYSLTHVTVFYPCEEAQNRDAFYEIYRQAVYHAESRNLQAVYIGTNFCEVFPRKLAEACTFCKLACVLAVQKLFSVYMFSSAQDMTYITLNLNNAVGYDFLTVNCASTESLSFYFCNVQIAQWSLQDRECKKEERHFIRIGKTYVEELSDDVRLCAMVNVSDQEQIVWFSVKKSYGEYLTEERADAFVVAFLPSAMRCNMDIVCDSPVTRRLLYQLNHYLIPLMAANMEEYHPITIYAKTTDAVLMCAGAVGTGWTGGVDSMFTYMQNLHTDGACHKLTHLLIANNGALEGGDYTREILRQMVDKAEKGFAKEEQVSVIGVDTNLQEVLSEAFAAVVPFRHVAVALALQKLFGLFLESSAYDFSHFGFRTMVSDFYALAVLSCFETDCTVFYDAGGAFSRGQKLRELSDFPQAQKTLHPCIYALRDNCGRCGKCIRTEAALYGLGTLDRFSAVFNVKDFERNRKWITSELIFHRDNLDCEEALTLLDERGIRQPSKAYLIWRRRSKRLLKAVKRKLKLRY